LHERVLSIRDSAPLAVLLDALLLTEADCAVIAADLPGLSPEAVQLYERSLFTVQRPHGRRRAAPAAPAAFALRGRPP
jgi:hypothetical protein